MITTNQKISAAILARLALGDDLAVAIDRILGAGTFDKLASDIWTAAQSGAQR